MSRTMSAADKAKSDARRAEKKAAVDASIAAGLERLKDPEVWREFIARKDSKSNLARYSFRNQLLIFQQDPMATDTAGFNQWRARGRQVRKGEPSHILVFSPIKYRKAQVDGKVLDRAPEAGEDSVIKMTGVGIECVWDVSQTDPIDGKEFKPATTGAALDIDAVREAIVQMAGDHAEEILAALETATEEAEELADA